LDRHDFNGIFIGYTATDSNIQYIDLTSGLVKTSHHAVFDECWFNQPWWPPAAQLLYNLGIQLCGATQQPHPPSPPLPSAPEEDTIIHVPCKDTTPMVTGDDIPTIPAAVIEDDSLVVVSVASAQDPHPFGEIFGLHTTVRSISVLPQIPPHVPPLNHDATMVDHYNITSRDVE
jgi:hypothetical protein